MLRGVICEIDEPSIGFVNYGSAMDAFLRIRFFIHSAITVPSSPVHLLLGRKGISRDIGSAHSNDHMRHLGWRILSGKARAQ